MQANKKGNIYSYMQNRKSLQLPLGKTKTTVLCGIISATLASLSVQPVYGAKKEINLSEGNPVDISENITGTDGAKGTGHGNGGDGEDALLINVVAGSSQQENILSVNAGSSVRGGEGGWGGGAVSDSKGSTGEKVVQLSPGVILHLLTLVIFPVVVVVWGLMVMVAEMVV